MLNLTYIPRRLPLVLILGLTSSSAIAGERDATRAWKLGELWNPSHAAGPHAPEPPAPKDAIVPTGWVTARLALSARRAYEALVLRYVVPSDAPVPRVGSTVFPGDAARWETEKRGAHAAFVRVEVDEGQVRMARLRGARALFVNGEGFVGDSARRGYGGVPVELRAGWNDLLVLGIHEEWSEFELELWDPPTRIVIADWDLVVPRATEWTEPNTTQGGWGDVRPPIFNASVTTADRIHVHYEQARSGQTPGTPSEWSDGWWAPPLGLVLPAGAWTFEMSAKPSSWPDEPDEERNTLAVARFLHQRLWYDGDLAPVL